MLQNILKLSEIKSFKIKYCCEKRDPDFETKIHDVLVVYKQISMQFAENGDIIIPMNEPMVHTVSVIKNLEYRHSLQREKITARRPKMAVSIAMLNINGLGHYYYLLSSICSSVKLSP